jgi:hypothetical protein
MADIVSGGMTCLVLTVTRPYSISKVDRVGQSRVAVGDVKVTVRWGRSAVKATLVRSSRIQVYNYRVTSNLRITSPREDDERGTTLDLFSVGEPPTPGSTEYPS